MGVSFGQFRLLVVFVVGWFLSPGQVGFLGPIGAILPGRGSKWCALAGKVARVG